MRMRFDGGESGILGGFAVYRARLGREAYIWERERKFFFDEAYNHDLAGVVWALGTSFVLPSRLSSSVREGEGSCVYCVPGGFFQCGNG